MISRSKYLYLLSFLTCFVANSSEAGVCFVNGGDCGHKIAVRDKIVVNCENTYTNPKEYSGITVCEDKANSNQKCVATGHRVSGVDCWRIDAKICTDYSTANTDTSFYYNNENDCKAGLSTTSDKICKIENTTSKVGGLTTCYKRVTKECSDYNSAYYASESSCKNGIASTKTCTQVTKSLVNYITCYQRVDLTCNDGYTLGSCPSGKECFTQAASNDSSKTGVCYKAKTCSEMNANLYTSSTGVSNYSKFDIKEHNKIAANGGKCYKVDGCAGNLFTSESDNNVFKYTKYSNKKIDNTPQNCYEVTGCATNYVTSAEKDTTHFKYSSGSSKGGKTCYSATGCADAYTTTANGSAVATTKKADGSTLNCYNKCPSGYTLTKEECKTQLLAAGDIKKYCEKATICDKWQLKTVNQCPYFPATSSLEDNWFAPKNLFAGAYNIFKAVFGINEAWADNPGTSCSQRGSLTAHGHNGTCECWECNGSSWSSVSIDKCGLTPPCGGATGPTSCPSGHMVSTDCFASIAGYYDASDNTKYKKCVVTVTTTTGKVCYTSVEVTCPEGYINSNISEAGKQYEEHETIPQCHKAIACTIVETSDKIYCKECETNCGAGRYATLKSCTLDNLDGCKKDGSCYIPLQCADFANYTYFKGSSGGQDEYLSVRLSASNAQVSGYTQPSDSYPNTFSKNNKTYNVEYIGFSLPNSDYVDADYTWMHEAGLTDDLFNGIDGIGVSGSTFYSLHEKFWSFIFINDETCYWSVPSSSGGGNSNSDWFDITVVYGDGWNCCKKTITVGGSQYTGAGADLVGDEASPGSDVHYHNSNHLKLKDFEGVVPGGYCGRKNDGGYGYTYITNVPNKTRTVCNYDYNNGECSDVKVENGKTYYKKGNWQVWHENTGNSADSGYDCLAGYSVMGSQAYNASKVQIIQGGAVVKESTWGGSISYDFEGGKSYIIKVIRH